MTKYRSPGGFSIVWAPSEFPVMPAKRPCPSGGQEAWLDADIGRHLCLELHCLSGQDVAGASTGFQVSGKKKQGSSGPLQTPPH